MALITRSTEHVPVAERPNLEVSAYEQETYAVTKHKNTTHSSYTLWRFPTSLKMRFSEGDEPAAEINAWTLNTVLNINGFREGDHHFSQVLFTIERVPIDETAPKGQEDPRFSRIGTVVIRSIQVVVNNQGEPMTVPEITEPLYAPLIIDTPHPAHLRSRGGVPPFPEYIDKKITATYPPLDY